MAHLDHEICSYETDIHGLIRPSQLLRYSMHMSQVQQASERLFTPETAEQMHLGWMLARFKYTQHATAHRGEKLRIVCSPRSVQLAYYIREARITRGGEEIADVSMVWIPVDLEARRILRVSELEQVFSESAPKTEHKDLRRLPLPKGLPEQTSLNIPYSLCDSNGHFSSANYVDLLCDVFGFWRESPMRMESMQLDYHAEFRPEERLTLFGAREGGIVTARGVHDDGKTGFVASLRFAEIED